MNFNHNKTRTQKNLDEYDYNKDPYGNNYTGIHILPRWREDEIKKKRDEQIEKYREMWSKEIEERRIKKLEEEKKKKELDMLEEERVKKEIEELNRRELKEKKGQKEKENKISKENEQLIKNKYVIKNQNKFEENGLINDNNINNNINNNITSDNINIINNNNVNQNNEQTKSNLVKSESFNYLESMEKLKNKYKNVDLNNIHFYPQSRRDIEIRKLTIEKKLNFNKLKNNVLNNKRSVNEFEFSPNPKLLDDSKNPQIARLKKDINYGYMQISSALKSLRKNIIQADNNKLKAEKELKFITTDFNKEQKYQLQLEKIEYDKRKKDNTYINNYNNDFYTYTNINDIDPMYYNIAPIVQSNMNNNNNKNEMSNLAKVGQNLIKLNSESEFIPIGMNYYYNNMYENIGVNEGIQMENKTEHGELKHETVFEPSDD